MEMISLTFPPIHKSVKVDKKKPDNAGNFINIRKGVAVIVSTGGVFCFDLKNFFKDSQLVPDDMGEQFDELFDFLEGKSFNPQFWEFLTKGDYLKVLDVDCLYIENEKIEKSLIYQPQNVDLLPAINLLKKNFTQFGSKGALRVGIDTSSFKQFLDGFGKTIQGNAIITENTAEEGLYRFTVNNVPYIFGLMKNNHECTQKQFLFDHFSDFIKVVDEVPAPPLSNIPKPEQFVD